MLTVTEFERCGQNSSPNIPHLGGQLASTSQAPAAGDQTICTLGSRTRYIMLASSVACRVELDAASDANSMPVFANVPVVLAVSGGEEVHHKTF